MNPDLLCYVNMYTIQTVIADGEITVEHQTSSWQSLRISGWDSNEACRHVLYIVLVVYFTLKKDQRSIHVTTKKKQKKIKFKLK